jgi:DNA-binding MarR family transcriptional regulator
MSSSHPTVSTDQLVDELTARLRRVDLVAWTRIVAWAEESDLSLEDLRLLLALAAADGARSAGELTELTGLSLDAVYRAIHRFHGRGYTREERRRHSLTDAGHELVAALDAAHRAGIEAYVAELSPEERRQIEVALGLG